MQKSKQELEDIYKRLLIIFETIDYIIVNHLNINYANIDSIRNALHINFEANNLKGLKEFEKEILNGVLYEKDKAHRELFFSELGKRMGDNLLKELLQKYSYKPIVNKVLKRGFIKNEKELKTLNFILDEYFEVLHEDWKQGLNKLIFDYSQKKYE